MAMRSEYHNEVSPCCGTTLHRPDGDKGPWFCMDCGAIDSEVRKLTRQAARRVAAVFADCPADSDF